MILVFDTTALSHFARAGRLDALEQVTAGFRRVVPEVVLGEILGGVAEHPALGAIGGCTWFEIVDLDDIAETMAFATYVSEFDPTGVRHAGEAAVLSWARLHNAIAIVDDRTATYAAQRDRIEVHGTLWLIVNGYVTRALKREEAEEIVDRLLETDMRLPVDSGKALFAWAYGEGLLPPS